MRGAGRIIAPEGIPGDAAYFGTDGDVTGLFKTNGNHKITVFDVGEQAFSFGDIAIVFYLGNQTMQPVCRLDFRPIADRMAQ